MMNNVRFSANLGLLFNELSLPEAVLAARAHGFEAVELHFPYQTPIDELKAALDESGLPLLSLNTIPGDVRAGDFGLCALPDRMDEARRAIEQALVYGEAVGAQNIHVMAGKLGAHHNHDEAKQTFIQNLTIACIGAAGFGANILIEPMNPIDAPNYFLSSMDEASAIIELVDQPNLKIMFDCYHNQLIEGELLKLYETHRHHIGHIQFASVPDRKEPDHGDIDYNSLLPQFLEAGYSGYFGAEYRPKGRTADGLDWMKEFNPPALK